MLQSVDLKSMDQVDHSGFNSNPFPPKSDLGTNQQISQNEILPKTLSFASYQPVLPPHTAEIGSTTVYKECLKNHAASLGGHALDGCGEFMPEQLTDPGLMKCAACGCHRNFHRQDTAERRRDPPHPSSIIPSTVGITPPHFSLLPRRFASSPSTSPSPSPSPPRQLNPPPPPPPPLPSAAVFLQQYSPGPHMLMALSTGKGGASPPPSDQINHHHRKKTTTESSPTRHIKISDHHHHQTRRNQNPNPNNKNNNNSAIKRKRFRSKFSGEQKEKMRRFSEGLNWRIQRSDEKLVSDFCEDVGVSKTVLKVWMHNNKNTIGKIPRNSNNNSNHSSSNNNVEEDQADQQLSHSADQQLSHSASDHLTNIDGGLGLIHHHLGNNNGSSCSP
ncbi:hypothetical protein QQ045_020060 [Rhodiola kirilowii]